MSPETLRMLIKSLRHNEIRTAKEVAEAGPFSDVERVRKWLDVLEFAELVEKVNIYREPEGRPGNPNLVGYRLKFAPEN